MTIFQGAVMGVVQGLTEFLPVSSSGHLALARHILGAGPAEDVAFEVAVHAGTLLAVILFFWKKLVELSTDAIHGKGDGRRWFYYIVIATIPAGLIGILFEERIDNLFNDLTLVGVAWIFTAIILYLSERIRSREVVVGQMGIWRAIAIGFAQAVAIIPGVSRSGSTISTGLLAGVDRKGAVDFSFILSLPVILGAIVLTFNDWLDGGVILGLPHIAGAITALLSGYFAIAVMLKVVTNRKLIWFAFYCLLLGVFTIVHSIF